MRWVRFCLFFLISTLAAEELKIAVLSDIHVSPGNINDTKLAEAVKELNESDADLVLVTGDLTNRGRSAELEQVRKRLDALTKPCYVIPGNHETNWSDNAARTFPRLFGAERFATTVKGVVLIGFSTGPYLKMGDGFARAEDIAFLRDSLAKFASRREPVLIVCHYPPAIEFSNWRELTDTIRPYNIIGIICGHWHQMYRAMINGFDSVVCRELVRKNNTFGYALFTVNSGKHFEVREKRLGQAETVPVPQNPPLNDPPAPVYPPLPAGVTAKLIRQDAASIFTGAAVGDGLLCYGTSDGRLVGLDAATGAVRWERPLGGAVYATPVFLDGVLLAGSIENELVGVDAATGRIRWRIPTPAPVTNSGAAAENSFFTGTGDRDFLRIEPTTGRILWRTDLRAGTFQAAPAVSGNLVAVGVWDTNLYTLDTVTGRKLWSWNNGSSQLLFSPGNVTPVIAGGQIITVAPDRRMTALDADTGKPVWRTDRFKVRESLAPSADGKLAYARTMDGTLLAVETGRAQFTLKWECDLGIGYEHTPTPPLEIAGVVLAGSRRGTVAAVDAATGRLLWRFQAGSTAINAFTPAGPATLYATLLEGTVYRITLP